MDARPQPKLKIVSHEPAESPDSLDALLNIEDLLRTTLRERRDREPALKDYASHENEMAEELVSDGSDRRPLQSRIYQWLLDVWSGQIAASSGDDFLSALGLVLAEHVGLGRALASAADKLVAMVEDRWGYNPSLARWFGWRVRWRQSNEKRAGDAANRLAAAQGVNVTPSRDPDLAADLSAYEAMLDAERRLVAEALMAHLEADIQRMPELRKRADKLRGTLDGILRGERIEDITRRLDCARSTTYVLVEWLVAWAAKVEKRQGLK